MRKNMFVRSIAITVIALIIATLPVFAGSTTKTLSTNYSVVNLSTTTDASVTASYYKDDGSTWTADADKTNFTVAKNYGQYQVRQYFDTTLTAGKGSVVLSSTEPLAAVVQIQARGQVPTMGAYTGYTSGSNQFFAPLVLRKYNTASGMTNTQIMIQNIMNETISVDVVFTPRPGGGAAFTKTFASILKYTTQYYDIADELSSNLQDGWIGSATITAQTGKQIAVVVNVFAGADGMQTTNAFPAESIGTTWAVPQFASKLPNGFNTTINLQNVTSTDIAAGAITLECNPEAGFSGTISKTNLAAVPGNSAYAFNPVDVTQGFPTNWQGACVVTSPQNIVVFNQLRRPGVTGDISAYECFLTSSTNSKVVVPLVAKRLTNGFASGITIMNLDTVNTAHVTVTFTRSPESSVGNLVYTKDYDILPRTNQQINMRLSTEPVGVGIPDNWQGSAVVTTRATFTAVPLIAYVQLTNINILPGDNWMSHQAFLLSEP